VNYLIDTHVLIWSLVNPDKLSVNAKQAIEDTRNDIFVSAISFWEISLKFSVGKLKMDGISPEKLPELAIKTGFNLIPLLPEECALYHQVDLVNHKDPFDKMLIGQAIKLDMTLISKDSKLIKGNSTLKILW